MSSTRQRIMDHLQVKRFATATDISRALRMTSANVRHHISILLDEGVVEIAGQRPSRGRGRPTQIFTLTQQAQQHNLDGLASALLHEFVEARPLEEGSSHLLQVAKRLKGDPHKTSSNLTQRLYQAVQRLNELHYQSRWEAHAEAPLLILGHCPFAAILPQHPELCQMDAYLIEELTNVKATQCAKLQQDTRGATYCMFIVGK
jgi:predicted ArsR family transcriptional regulator